MVKKSTALERWQIDDAARLKALFDEREPKISQLKFGQDFDIGSQGMVWQYLTGMRPLNIDAAMKFARGLNVSIDRFSETLADQIAAAYALSGRQAQRLAPDVRSLVSVAAETAPEMRLLTVYRLGDDRNRQEIDSIVNIIASGISSPAQGANQR